MDETRKLQCEVSPACKARLAYFATLVNKTQGIIVEQALNELFEKEDIPCAESSTTPQPRR
jgi:predicted transcriptional regulator